MRSPSPTSARRRLRSLAAALLLLPPAPLSADSAAPPPAIRERGAPVAPASPSPPASEPAPAAARTVTVGEDGIATVRLSGTGLNRLQLPDAIGSAHTNSDAVDLTLEGSTAIVTFRSAVTADVLLLTQAGQFLVRLVPAELPPQSVRLRQATAEAQAAPSYQSQLAFLIEAAYRRDPPRGYQTERVGESLPVDGAVRWWLTLRHKGRILTVEEYTLHNDGAVAHPVPLPAVAARFPTARALSVDPELLAPGGWGRVLVVLDTDSTAAAGGSAR